MSFSGSGFRVHGLVAATYTPFCADGSPDLASIPAHAAELSRQGVRWIFVCGTTGEGATMSVAERCAVTEAWLAAAPAAGLSVMAHVGAEAIADTLALTAHAAAHGAGGAALAPGSAPIAAISVIAPCYNKPAGIDGVIELLARVGAAAPALPLCVPPALWLLRAPPCL